MRSLRTRTSKQSAPCGLPAGTKSSRHAPSRRKPDRVANHQICSHRRDRSETPQLRSTVFSSKNGSVGLHLDGARWLLCKPRGALSKHRSVRLILTSKSASNTQPSTPQLSATPMIRHLPEMLTAFLPSCRFWPTQNVFRRQPPEV